MFVLHDLPAADTTKKQSLRDIMNKAYEKGQQVMFRNGKLYNAAASSSNTRSE